MMLKADTLAVMLNLLLTGGRMRYNLISACVPLASRRSIQDCGKKGCRPVKTILSEMNPKRKFTIILLMIHFVALPTISVTTYVIVKQNAILAVYNTGRLYLSAMGSIKHYVAEELRPVFYREMPGRFIVQGMSRSYVSSQVASRVMHDLPHYIYKNASLNPKKRPQNMADTFESSIIEFFDRKRMNTEWRGLVEKDGSHYYVIARAGDPFSADCLRCHGDPMSAPPEMIAIYGTTAGFHQKENDLVDATFVYIPIDVPLAAARKIVAYFVGSYVLVGTVILMVINVRFTKLYNQIDAEKQLVENINLEVLNMNHDMESMISERAMNLLALSVADRVRNPATAVAGTIKRLLKREDLPPQIREKLSFIVPEADKLEAIVSDYESILKTRQIMFKMEDLNEMIGSILPLIEEERMIRDIRISLRLSEMPQRCMANRQLLRVAILHVLKNAVEAVPEGGSITVETGVEDDHVFISVADNGKGIPPEDMKKIFDLFYSLKRRRIGMGLPIAKQIIEEHRGIITVDSVPGRTVFRLSFPSRWSEKELADGTP
jgi:signal transduction histidine kinase